jgi:hypothetical protein
MAEELREGLKASDCQRQLLSVPGQIGRDVFPPPAMIWP